MAAGVETLRMYKYIGQTAFVVLARNRMKLPAPPRLSRIRPSTGLKRYVRYFQARRNPLILAESSSEGGLRRRLVEAALQEEQLCDLKPLQLNSPLQCGFRSGGRCSPPSGICTAAPFTGRSPAPWRESTIAGNACESSTWTGNGYRSPALEDHACPGIPMTWNRAGVRRE